jgi:acyl carrier protein
MTSEKFMRELEEALEIDANSLDESQVLADSESWDSMSALIFMALADEKLEIAVTGHQIAQCETVGDLLALLGNAIVA